MLGTVAGSWPSEGTSVMVLPYGALVGFCVALIDHSTRTDVGTVLL